MPFSPEFDILCQEKLLFICNSTATVIVLFSAKAHIYFKKSQAF
jgi:hypothetical protein